VGLLAVSFVLSPSIADADSPYFNYPSYGAPRAAALGPWPWNLEIGGGPAPVLGGAGRQLYGGSEFVIGGGFNLSPRAGFVLEFMNTGLGVTNSNLQSNAAVSGDASISAVTLNPIWRFRVGGPVGGYVIGGGGYYERDVHFNQPVSFTFQNHLGQTVTGTGYQSVHQDDGAGGLNIGAGLTWNVLRGMKLFAEVRYHYMFTSGYATQILPITFGLRW
jgi:opacity protein-like surface antigen